MRAPGHHANRPRRFLSLGSSALVLALPLMGCGDYDPATSPAAGGTANGDVTAAGAANLEASCTNLAACGGDVSGTWVVASSCLPVTGEADISGFGLNCTSAGVTGELEVTGTWTANGDGTFTDDTITSGGSQLELSAECLNVSGTVTTCDRLGGALQALGYAMVTCADAASGGGCTCDATVEQMGGMAFVARGPFLEGMYTVSDDVLEFAGRTPREYSYCVSGSTLTMTPQGSNNNGTLMGTIVLQKQ